MIERRTDRQTDRHAEARVIRPTSRESFISFKIVIPLFVRKFEKRERERKREKEGRNGRRGESITILVFMYSTTDAVLYVSSRSKK